MGAMQDFPRTKRIGQRYSEEEKRRIVQGFEAFEGSVFAYSKMTGITYVTLQRWLRSGMDARPAVGVQSSGFMELQIRQASFSVGDDVAVELPGGIRLRFAAGTDAGYIGRLVRELVA